MCHGRWTSWPLLTGLVVCATAFGQTAADRQALTDLDRQTQALYQQVSHGIVRAQLPTTRPVTISAADPLARWANNLSAEQRAMLLSQLRTPGVTYVAEIIPGTQPSIEIRRINPGPSGQQGSTAPDPMQTISPNVVGVIVDDQGDVLLPAYTSEDAVAGQPVPVMMSDGSVRRAKFIGSDAQSNITVIQVQAPPAAGLRPLALGTSAPPEGALVMLASVDPALTRLGIWTRWSTNQGIVLRTDGAVAGFSGNRHFVPAAAYIPIVRQLIQNGRVQRPVLGVKIKWVMPNDPLREFDQALGQTPAIRIFEVLPGTPAERAGLKTGDLILSLAGEQVSDSASFATAIATKNGPTELEILRDDQRITVTVELEAKAK